MKKPPAEPGADGWVVWCGASEKLFDSVLKLLGLCSGGVAAGDVAVAVDEELSEVPFDALRPEEAGAGGLEVLVERVGFGAVDFYFGEERECDVVLQAAEVFDFVGAAGFLVAELVAGEGEDCEASFAVFAVEGFEAGVLGSEAAAAGDIDDEEDLVAVGV